MPELPEVEVIKNGIEKAFLGKIIQKVVVRHPKLRFPVSPEIAQLTHKKITQITRRGKYILIPFKEGTLLIHLGMSGRFTEVPLNTPPRKHDHIDLVFSKSILRYTDARRFGAFVWATDPTTHPLLTILGPEPFSPAFSTDYFYNTLQKRKVAIKIAIMNASIVVGVGNIYASEALFRSKISPFRLANSLTKKESERLAEAIRTVLAEAIEKGGSTLRDYYLPDGDTGYFQHTFAVYGREGKRCIKCKTLIKKSVQGQRSTYYCEQCQK
jgi:formamidopyrimidine-DNA glycosylase